MTRNSSRSQPGRGLARLGFDSPSIDRITAKAAALDLLDALLRSTLPPGLAGHCRLANVRAGRLVWLVADAAAGVRLRQHQQDLERLASTETGQSIAGSVIRIAPPERHFPAPRNPSATERAHMVRLASLLGLDAAPPRSPGRR
jgi:hypothetical protein